MKKTLLLVLTVLTIGFTGCSKDSHKTLSDDIIGRWYVTHMEVSKILLPVKGTCLDGMYAEFGSDLTYKSYESCNKESYSGTYTKSGDVMTCNIEGETVSYRIIELSGNNATLELTEGGESIKIKAVRK